MTDEAIKLGRRAVWCPGWEWRPGTLVRAIVRGAPRICRLTGTDRLCKESWILVHESRIYDDTDDVRDVIPVFSDPATKGCAIDVVRKLYGCPDLSVVRDTDTEPPEWGWSYDWTTEEGSPWVQLADIMADTEEEAIVQAFERATGAR